MLRMSCVPSTAGIVGLCQQQRRAGLLRFRRAFEQQPRRRDVADRDHALCPLHQLASSSGSSLRAGVALLPACRRSRGRRARRLARIGLHLALVLLGGPERERDIVARDPRGRRRSAGRPAFDGSTGVGPALANCVGGYRLATDGLCGDRLVGGYVGQRSLGVGKQRERIAYRQNGKGDRRRRCRDHGCLENPRPDDRSILKHVSTGPEAPLSRFFVAWERKSGIGSSENG